MLAAGERPRRSRPPPWSATLTLLVPMAGLIDAAAEAERLGKLLAKTQRDLAKTRGKLANENFVRNAPPEVVAHRARARRRARAHRDLTSAAQLERVRGTARAMNAAPGAAPADAAALQRAC